MLSSCSLPSFIKFCAAISEKLKMSQPIGGQAGHLCFPFCPKNTNLIKDIEFLLTVKFRQILFDVPREKSKMSKQNQRLGSHLGFLIDPKNKNLVEDVELLLPVKFCQIPFSVRGEVKNVSANQWPGWLYLFSDRSKTCKIGRGC